MKRLPALIAALFITAIVACGMLFIGVNAVTKRRWRQGGRERHHLIDPRNGAPAPKALENS
jgi:thiamine biosynthesis lipoprotein ApbE